MKRVVGFFALVLGFVWAASASAEVQTYRVQPGDRLPLVAAQFGLSAEELLAANPRSAYGMSCGNPRTVTLRNGDRQALCGRPRPYLIAGKTLVIPAPRIALQTENIRLNAEVVALRAEMEQLRKARETEKLEFAALEVEYSDLQDDNEILVAANAELQGKYREAHSDFEMVLSRRPKQVEVQRVDYRYVVLAILGTASLAFFVIIGILCYRWKNEKKFDRLVRLVQPSVLEQAASNKQRGAELDQQARELEKQKGEQGELQAKLQERKSEQERLDNDLASREQALAQGQNDLAAAKRAVEKREGTCDRREREIQEAERGLLERNEAFRRRVLSEEEHLRTESAAVARGKEELLAAQRELEEKRIQVEAGLRALAEDAPAIQRNREEADRHIREAASREDEARRAEESAAKRIKEAQDREAAAMRQEEQAESRERAAAEAERILVSREEEVGSREEKLHQAEDALRTEQTEFERSLEAAGRILEVAGGLEKAQRIINRAKRKTEIVSEFDKREKAVVDREEACTRREHDIALWAAQVGALKEDDADGEATMQRLPLDVDTLQDIVPSDESIRCAACGGKFADRGEFDAHKKDCPKAAPHTPTIVGAPAGGRASVAASPPESAPSESEHGSSGSCEPSTIYCQHCKEGFPLDVYAAEHASHDERLTSGEDKQGQE